jgi:GNAT superfamily N-acetyltransferase
MRPTEFTLEIVAAKGPPLEELDGLILQMYEYMERHGLLLPLAHEGAAKLRRGIESSLGRSGRLILARSGQEIVGFAHGVLRLIPDYLGGGVVGYVGHTFVADACRGTGVGSQMFAVLQEWFLERGAGSVELQVLAGNGAGIRFWERNGFTRELLQMRRFLASREK